ncbi:acyl-ACP--UDP-N-acetylglucosamine O-acyltransferase [Candidatus Sumerlaeota bacterium]|nr:acyl-ACP--UDP-N-acetylglucosamine O-acyltransferase [Candidatus Sumerlaeota bacterium]
MRRSVLEPPQIHPTAMIDPAAQIEAGAVVEPYAIIGRNVSIGEETRIGAFTVIGDHTAIGRRNRIFHHASVGVESQDLKFKGEESHLIVGDGNIIREYTTLNRATGAGEATRVGNDNVFMAYSHLAHNSVVGNNCVIANAAEVGGHVVVENYAILGGLVAVHQFCRIGAYSITGAASKIVQDVPPYLLADGHPARPHGLNIVGLRRHKFTKEQVREIELAYEIVFAHSLRVEQSIVRLRERFPNSPHVARIADFLEQAERGIIRPKKKSLPCSRREKK